MTNKYVLVIIPCSIDYFNQYLSSFCILKYDLPIIDSCAAYVREEDLSRIKAMKDIKYIKTESLITAQMDRARVTVNHKTSNYHNTRPICVAVLDTGITRHIDFDDRIIAFKDFIKDRPNPYDDCGHGTHVAGIIAGSGAYSKGRYMGIAPNATIAAIKVLDKGGNGNVSDVLAGLQWIVMNAKKYNIRIVNVSVGTAVNSRAKDCALLVKGVEAAWDYGLTVVVAAGNNGPDPMSITNPGISKKVITVGSSDDDEKTMIWGLKKTMYSGRGPTDECVIKPDILAPGNSIVSCLNQRGGYTAKSGTSMSTPMISGCAALLLSKNPSLTNKQIKAIILSSATNLNLPHNRQGFGLLNINNCLNNNLF